MRKIDFIFNAKGLLTFFFCAMFSISLFAQKPSAIITEASGPIVIDGVADEAWAGAEKQLMTKPFIGETPTIGAEGDSYWQMLWSDSGIFVLVTVADDAWAPYYDKHPDSTGTNAWRYDRVEVYFDCNYTKEDGGDANAAGHHQWQAEPTLDMSGIAADFDNKHGVISYAYNISNPAYKFEFFTKWANLVDADNNLVDMTGEIGFDVYVTDNDVLPVAVRNRMVWGNDGGTYGENWSNMDDAGLIELDGVDDLIYIDGITLEDAVIDVNNGTLEMMPVIDPEDATLQELTWTLTNVTGFASIDDMGKITAYRNGTVTVMASSKDGGWVDSNEATITITNQIESLSDWSFVVNGDLSDLNADGWANNWAKPADGAIEDGVMVFRNPAGTSPWSTRTSQYLDIPYEMKDSMFHIYIKAWCDSIRTICLNIEDKGPGAGSNRYGSSTDPEAAVPNLDTYSTSPGCSSWEWEINTEPTMYKFTVSFPNATETSIAYFGPMVGHLTHGTVYVDSMYLIPAYAETNIQAEPYVEPEAINNVEEASFAVYPNPLNGKNTLTVEFKSAIDEKVAMFNVQGQLVAEKVVQGNLVNFDVSEMPQGIYLIRTQSGVAQKFIK